jgi:drug/metabolite transporter (DMT)-like permease
VSKNLIDWLLFTALSVIWGSSFILMKIGLDNHLTAYQVAAIRITSSGLVLLPIAAKSFRNIPGDKLLLVFLSGVLGSLIPAFLFCVAEERIDSSLAGTLNSLTPIFVITTGALFFKVFTPAKKIIGVIIAFAGAVLLLLSKGGMGESQHIGYVLFVVLATVMYGVNVNMVSKHLMGIPALQLTAGALTLNAIPAIIILYFTGFFHLDFSNKNILVATAAATTLGVGGTAIATIMFYSLVKRASGIFASMVTYGIPFVAIAWGIYFKEDIGWKQMASLLVILFGVYWVNKKK